MKKFCPRCGQETEGLGPRGLCADCYRDENELIEVPDELDVTVCSNCGAVLVGGNWIEVASDQERIYEVLDHNIPGENVVAVSFTEDEESGNYHVKILVEQEVDGETLQDEVETTIVIEKDQCETCAKFHGGYYTYKIQVRGDVEDDAIEDVMARAAEITNRDREHFVSDLQRSKHGYDIYVSTRTMAEELLKVLEDQYELEKQRSKELVGLQEGQEVYRSVISARVVSNKEV